MHHNEIEVTTTEGGFTVTIPGHSPIDVKDERTLLAALRIARVSGREEAQQGFRVNKAFAPMVNESCD